MGGQNKQSENVMGAFFFRYYVLYYFSHFIDHGIPKTNVKNKNIGLNDHNLCSP